MNRDLAIDTAKMALPVGGGSVLNFLHFTDELLTIGTHAVGFCAAVCGLVWYFNRMRRDLNRKHEDKD